MSAPSPWLTVKEAAVYARCGSGLIYRSIRSGQLRAAKIGGRRDLRILEAWVTEWLVRSSTPVEIHRRVG
jgi:excisionase family DNA binding protein